MAGKDVPCIGSLKSRHVAWPAHSHFTPLFRFALSHVQRRGLSSADGAEANFTLSSATASVCPLRLPSGPLEFRACGFASGGLLHAWGTQTTNLQQRNRPYGAVGGSLLASVSASQTIDIVADLAVGERYVSARVLVRHRISQ